MKRRMMILFGILALGAVSAFAQSNMSEKAVAALKEDLSRSATVSNSYEFRPIKDTRPPRGYKPFYISHYGRHGSRSTTGGGDSYERLVKYLTEAKEMGILKPCGDSLLNVAQQVVDRFGGMAGRLTQRGVREHQTIAMRMYDRYPKVFRGKKSVRGFSSTVQRCIISMNSFTIGLAKKNSKLHFYLDSGDEFQKYLNPGGEYKVITAGFNAGKYVPDYQADTTFTVNYLFTDPDAARTIFGRSRRLMDAIFSTATTAEDFDIEEDIFHFLPFEFIYERWAGSNIDLYVRHGNSVEFWDQLCPLVEPTIQDIITKADEAIRTGEYAADLRFGHDHPLMKIIGYLGIEDAGERWSAETVNDNWLGFYNMCMGSNLQLVFYKNKKNDVIVKFLYQEQETKLRKFEPFYGPYYRWDDVKANIKGYLR